MAEKSKNGGDDELVAPVNADFICTIDGGVTGALAFLFPDGTWEGYPVVVGMDRGHRVLDVMGNLRLLQSIAARAAKMDRVFVVYERAGQNRTFGFRNSFINGRNDEFWRVLLTLGGFRFASVDPKTWQTACGIKKGSANQVEGETTKQRALNFLRRNHPNLEWLDDYTDAQQSGIVDAMCMALWVAKLRK